MATKISFVWVAPAAGESVTHFQLYENEVLAVDNIVEPNFSLLMDGMAEGAYDYQVSAVNEFGPGPLSVPVTINFILPSQVTGLAYTLV